MINMYCHWFNVPCVLNFIAKPEVLVASRVKAKDIPG